MTAGYLDTMDGRRYPIREAEVVGNRARLVVGAVAEGETSGARWYAGQRKGERCDLVADGRAFVFTVGGASEFGRTRREVLAGPQPAPEEPRLVVSGELAALA